MNSISSTCHLLIDWTQSQWNTTFGGNCLCDRVTAAAATAFEALQAAFSHLMSFVFETKTVDAPMIIPSQGEIRAQYDQIVEETPAIDPENQPAPYSVGCQKENRGKNRYLNVVAQDSTLVTFQGGHYCNGNWIIRKGEGNFPLLMLQGPLTPEKETTFWPTAFEHGSIIVMLTNYAERRRLKCGAYLPKETSQYQGIHVQNCKQKTMHKEMQGIVGIERITERKFLCTRVGDRKEITHFHYENWPDHGVALPALVAHLICEVIVQAQPSQKGVIVHCSAGLGRSGAFSTAMLAALRLKADPTLKKEPNWLFNAIGDAAKHVRSCRNGAIQTAEQFEMVYPVMEELIKMKVC